ncbi:MAG: NADH-quinone oxidoreductase subunit N [Bacteroidota bacterium]
MNALIALSVLAIIVMFFGVMKKKTVLLPIVLVGLLLVFVLNIRDWGTNVHYYNQMYIADNFSIAFNAVLIFGTFLVFMFAGLYYKTVQRPLEDIYALFLFSLVGALVMTSFGNLVMFFVGIETLSISLYILAGSKKFDMASNEAAMKYFLTGSFATGFLLFGIALVYGASGSFNLAEITMYISSNKDTLPGLFYAGMLLIFIGMAFKIAAVPFQFWAPDVYTGSPTFITAFMATVGKIAAIAAFYKFTTVVFPDIHLQWQNTICFFAAATIIFGNFGAIYQDNLKRMFAYSGIANAGYMLLAIVSFGPKSAGALLFYSLSYTVATITGFAVLMLIREKRGTFSVEAFKGLAKNNPVEAFAMTVAMLSLTGIPPLAGFMAKYNVFVVAAQSGYLWLVIVALIGSMVSIYYYFKPIVAMYFSNVEPQAHIHTGISYKIHIIFCTILIIGLGLLSGLFLNLF